MKITQVKLGRISTPLRVPFKTALRTVNSVEDVIVELHTDTTPTTKPCGTFWKKPVSPAAASSMWQTAPLALPTSGCPLPCRWNIKEVLT